MNAIRINGLTKQFKNFKLDNIAFDLPSGCVLGLIGENGAGKSTVIKLLLGALHPDAGQMSVLGQNSDDYDKNRVGVVLDNVGFPSVMDAQKIGRMLSRIYTQWDADAYQGYISRFCVPEKTPFGKLSRGNKMKVGLAAALSHNAELLILDEATSGLDPVARDEIIGIFYDFTRDENHSVLISSHIVSDLEKMCDYIAFLHKGKIMLYEEKDRLYEQYCLIQTSPEHLRELPADSVIGVKQSPYGAQVMIHRDAVPDEIPKQNIDLEQLFIFMTKEAEK